MPIKATDFVEAQPGFKWNRRAKCALFDVRGPSGRRVRRVLPFDSIEKAKKAFPAFRAEVKAEKYDDPQPEASTAQAIPAPTVEVTLASYVAVQWQSLHARCSASTEASNRNSLKSHLLPFFGKNGIAEIDEAACEDFTVYMKEKEKAPPTTNFALRLLRKILHHARRRKVIPAVPEKFHFVKEAQLKLEMSDEEQVRFLAAFDDREGCLAYLARNQKRSGKVVKSPHFGFKERNFGGGRRPGSIASTAHFQRVQRSRILFLGAIDLGLRETDLRLLKHSMVDLTSGVVEVVVMKTGKTATIALSDRLRDTIEEAVSQPIVNSEYVFTTESGRPYSDSTLRKYYAIAKHLAGITRRCRLNDLRHTFASNLASDGVSLLIIRDGLGHTTTRMSERYAKPSPRALEQMRASLNSRGRRADVTEVDILASKSRRR
jgi:site-specific recombinase XerD